MGSTQSFFQLKNSSSFNLLFNFCYSAIEWHEDLFRHTFQSDGLLRISGKFQARAGLGSDGVIMHFSILTLSFSSVIFNLGQTSYFKPWQYSGISITRTWDFSSQKFPLHLLQLDFFPRFLELPIFRTKFSFPRRFKNRYSTVLARNLSTFGLKWNCKFSLSYLQEEVCRLRVVLFFSSEAGLASKIHQRACMNLLPNVDSWKAIFAHVSVLRMLH